MQICACVPSLKPLFAPLVHKIFKGLGFSTLRTTAGQSTWYGERTGVSRLPTALPTINEPTDQEKDIDGKGLVMITHEIHQYHDDARESE